MKHLRLVAFVLAASVWTVSAALACDHGKGASAANAKGSCSAHGTAAAAGGSCSMHGTQATTAAMNGCPATAQCPMNSAQCKARMGATTAAANGCNAGTSAQSAAAMHAQCAGRAKGVAATAAAANGCCAGKAAAATTAHTMAACAGNMGVMAGMMAHCEQHSECAVCQEEASCSNDLRSAGVRAQVVALRNGAMVVFTADNAEGVRALQNTVARYNERVLSAYNTSAGSALCGECKSFRGAMASGKYTRELVNVKNGCQILLTSTDRTIVRKIHDMTGAQVAARVRT